MAFVTLPGASGGIVTVQSGTGDHIFVAQIIANTILAASTGGSLNAIQTVTAGSGATIPPPPTGGTDQSILYLFGAGGGTLSIPTGYNYVVDLMTGPETITGSNVQVIGFDSAGATYNLTGNVSLAADPSSDNNAITVSGVFNEATGDGNNTVTAFGTGTIGGGTGTNIYSLSPTVPSGILLQSNGVGDSVNVFGAGSATVDAAGTNADILGGAGSLTVIDSGTGDTVGALGSTLADVFLLGTSAMVFGGSGALFASVTGANNTVVGGTGTSSVTLDGANGDALGAGTSFSVIATGASDSIGAFSATTANITLEGGSDLAAGGTGSFNVTAENVGETILAGTGTASISIATLGLSTDDLILGSTSGSMSIDDEGQGDTIGPFGSSPVNVTLGSSSHADLLFGGSGGSGGSGGLAVTVDGSADTVVGGSGSSTITADAATAVFGGSGLVNFIGGAGTSTILGASGGSEMVTVGSGGVIFFTGAGSSTSNNSTIFGGSTTSTIIGSAGSNVDFSSLSGSGGFDYLATSGNESLGAGGSTVSNALGFFNSLTSIGGGAHDTVSGWTNSDSLFLAGYDSTQSSTVSAGGNVTFNLSNGAQITFTDTTTTEFNGRVLYINNV